MIEELQEIVGREDVLYDEEALFTYSYDAAPMLEKLPLSVVFPTEEEEVAALVRLAQAEGLKIVPRGSGTSLSGGAVPLENSLVINFAKMNRILEIDGNNLMAVVEPGVITADLHKAVEERGLFYPPDPASMTISTLGGNIAENAGGLRAFKYGVTGDFVVGLRLITADGSLLRTGRKAIKDVAGYNITKLIVGSEGTFVLITQAMLKLLPLPKAKATLVAYFSTLRAAAEAVSKIVADKIIPTTLEFLDDITIRAVEDYTHIGLPKNAGAMLLIEVDGHPAAVKEDLAAVQGICQRFNATEIYQTEDKEEALNLATARRSALPALARINPTTILEDATVPRDRLADMVEAVREIARKYNLLIGTFGHAGDGNFHPTILTDKRDLRERERVEKAMEEIFSTAVRLGGTITGEHGVGLTKAPFMRLMFSGQELEIMRRIKKAFDPKEIFNPGKIFPGDMTTD